ncbi:MAG: hypothetical protein N2749_00790 [Clostridia bacterium]|nr:hypothetical protein [Clostridia bacterium]
MSLAPQIIFGCDHYIQNNEQIYGDIKIIRNNTSLIDKVPDNINLVRIDKIYKINTDNEEKVYYNNYHYRHITPNNAIEWVLTSDMPSPGEEYYMQCLYVKISVEKYEDYKCPKCGGNGWYVNFLDTSNKSIKKLDGAIKLLQEFIKVLYTDKNPKTGYGSNINNVITQSVYDPSKVYSDIISSILDCEEQIKNIQKKAIMDGIEIDDQEKMLKVVVNKIQYVRDENCFYVSVSIYNVLGKAVKFNFKI